MATIPPRCSDLVPGADYQRFFGQLVGSELRPSPSTPEWSNFYVSPDEQFVNDATLACNWSPTGSTEDRDFLFLAMGTAGQDVLAARQAHLEEALGSTCTDTLDGRSCQHMESYNEEVQDVTHTLFVRGDTWVKIVQSNVPTEGLLNAVVQQTWA